ncbi:hypothetical protein CVT91_06555 [Candidatus Atribacteria bacterium HGW-Atribacteria-1]|nr:MAG: hypothetical protein CVT91_06555 [Candidatus Atribacteria bacterium HGW-Atribacteria-1]
MKKNISIKMLVLISLLLFLPLFVGCFSVPPTNQSPIITSTPITTATVNILYTYDIEATDPNNGDILTYSLAVNPTGMTINSSTGLINWTPDSTQIGDNAVTVEVSDGSLGDTQSFAIVVSAAPISPPVNHAPTIKSTPITIAIVGEEYIYNVNAKDSDGDILTYSLAVNPTGMTINSSTGLINWIPTSAQIGDNAVTVEVSDGKLSAIQDFIITVITSEDITYRALCVGIGDYLYFPDECGNTDLVAPPYDVDRMRQTLSYCKFGLSDTEFSTISYLKDGQATKSNILQKIASTFSGADNYDISYFYFSGHGMRYENTSYLCPADVTCYSPLDAYISVDELEQALSFISGTKVVFIDSCNSGGFIGKGKEDEDKIYEEELIAFNEDVINVFSLVKSKGLLTTNKYKVLTSCRYNQVCYEVHPEEGSPFGVFTMALCEGCGYSGSYPADTNMDTKVSLQEAYLYIIDWVDSLGVDQDVRVFPSNSAFTIAEY